MKKVTNAIKFAVRKYCEICSRLTLFYRVVVTSLTGVGLFYAATFVVHQLDNFLSRNVNEACLAAIVAVNVYVSRNALKRVLNPFKAKKAQPAPAYEQEAASEPSLEDLSEELSEELSKEDGSDLDE